MLQISSKVVCYMQNPLGASNHIKSRVLGPSRRLKSPQKSCARTLLEASNHLKSRVLGPSWMLLTEHAPSRRRTPRGIQNRFRAGSCCGTYNVNLQNTVKSGYKKHTLFGELPQLFSLILAVRRMHKLLVAHASTQKNKMVGSKSLKIGSF